jgi:hypothetical protein
MLRKRLAVKETRIEKLEGIVKEFNQVGATVDEVEDRRYRAVVAALDINKWSWK